jgi:hypothetical protein
MKNIIKDNDIAYNFAVGHLPPPRLAVKQHRLVNDINPVQYSTVQYIPSSSNYDRN